MLRHTFARSQLLELALTHRSMVYEAAGGTPEAVAAADARSDNEQLEFLGDAVLGLVVAESLCKRFPSTREGELTRMRASVVSRKHLGAMAKRLGLGRWLRVGRTLEQTAGRNGDGVLSNALEAIIAALYLDGGLDAARDLIEGEILDPALPELESSLRSGAAFTGAIGDFKSALQENVQSKGLGQPEYRLLEESGPAHSLRFRVGVWIAGQLQGEGSGSSKKEAQQEAARLAMGRLAGG